MQKMLDRPAKMKENKQCALDCLKLVAKVDFSSQDLEEHHYLLIWQLTILGDQSQYRHRRQLTPVQPCITVVTCSLL